jgi:hypothetical protein
MAQNLLTLLSFFFDRRSTGKTCMNEQSSRSHCVFTLRISGVNEVMLGSMLEMDVI